MSTDCKSGRARPTGFESLHVVLAACALVVTGHLLGAHWLSETVLGLPAGIWIIGLTAAILAPTLRSRLAAAAERLWAAIDPGIRDAGPIHTDSDSRLVDAGWWPTSPVASACVDLFTRLASTVAHIAFLPIWGGEVSPLRAARARAESWLAALPWPTRPLRIGLHMPDEEAEALTGSTGAGRVNWFRLATWEDSQAACRRHAFDAVVYHDGEGPVRIVTLERPGHAAGVIEWSDLQGDLTFGSLFPARVDPAAAVLEGATRTKVREGADLLRALVEAAATLSRCAHRLTLADLLLGRRVADQPERAGDLSLWRRLHPPAAAVLGRLAEAAAKHASTWPEASRLASSIAGAYLISCPGLEPAERVEAIGAAAAHSADAATALRLGAASIGALDDDRGLDWLVRADALIRRGQTPLASLDHAAFLESELVHGSDDPMSVGRAAAGICMVCAATPADRLAFVRDDMLEEMAYAGWLVGRDQDRGLLISVFLAIEHAHSGSANTARSSAPARARRGRSAAA